MLKIFNVKDKMDYLKEVIMLEHNEWAHNPDEDIDNRINNKILKVKSLLNDNDFCKLILLDDDNLVGFISIFPYDCDEYPHLTPWYGTMYVKKEYRGKGYSKILNDAILEEARNRGFKTIYLKSDLINYYEKFGAVFIEKFNDNEKLYKIDL